jgi:hypothetical protein
MPWWGWIVIIILGTLNIIGWFGDDDDDDDLDEKEQEDQDLARIIYDLRTEVAEQKEHIRQYEHEIATMERVGVIEGLWDLDECGYWFPKGKELAQFREEYPDRVPDDYEERMV